MKKKLITSVLSIALLLPGIAAAFSEEKDGIRLSVVDYTWAPNTVLEYINDKPATMEQLIEKGIRPLRITVKNKGNKVVMISGRSLRMPQIGFGEVARRLGYSQLNHVLGVIGFGTAPYALSEVYKYFYSDAREKLYGLFWSILYGCYLASCWHSRVTNYNDTITNAMLKIGNQQLLNYPLLIEPGKSESRLLLLDGNTWTSGKFAFQVFESNNADSAAVFKVDLGSSISGPNV